MTVIYLNDEFAGKKGKKSKYGFPDNFEKPIFCSTVNLDVRSLENLPMNPKYATKKKRKKNKTKPNSFIRIYT